MCGILSDLGFHFVSNTLNFPSIICGDKSDGSCKELSKYFCKILLMPR